MDKSFIPPLTRQEAANYLNIKKGTLEVWAVTGKGPRFLKMGRSVRYRKIDLDAYMENSIRANTSEA
jgi:excisionase family DNA binding protein